MGINIVAFVWGMAEATLFFIVPDVWLSIIAVKNLKNGLIACCWALAGALIGGSAIYLLSRNSAINLLEIYMQLPAVTSSLILSVAEKLETQGIFAILFAPLAGIPYKLYAAQASSTGIGLSAFMLISIPARLIRFVTVAVFAHFIFMLLNKSPIKLNSSYSLIVFWILFYIYYFNLMSH
jgi:hypothetical protein